MHPRSYLNVLQVAFKTAPSKPKVVETLQLLSTGAARIYKIIKMEVLCSCFKYPQEMLLNHVYGSHEGCLRCKDSFVYIVHKLLLREGSVLARQSLTSPVYP